MHKICLRITYNWLYVFILFIVFINGCSVELDVEIPEIDNRIPVEYRYNGLLESDSRFLAIGFDDFWDSDFTMTQPLLRKYRGNATFNRISLESDSPVASEKAKKKVQQTLDYGNEVGDHTFFHISFIVNYPLWDGQTYPRNEHFNMDRGDGCNAFGLNLETVVPSAFGVKKKWKDLTDADCQIIRESHSVFKHPKFSLLFDNLANHYLGIEGLSSDKTNWNGQEYTKGLFAGCKTTQNHEVWERIQQITQKYYEEQFGLPNYLLTWSLPGGDYNLYFQDPKSGLLFYDSDFRKNANDLSRFESSIFSNEKQVYERSFIDVLRGFGYFGTHGSLWPSKWDNLNRVAMYEHLFFNEYLSRQDALLYPTDLYVVNYLAPYQTYPESFFSSTKRKGTQMYDNYNLNGNRDFRSYIEYIRCVTARGGVAGGVFDAHDEFSTRTWFEELFKWCNAVGIAIISKATAYDICFNHTKEEGNLILNSSFSNSAAYYFTDSTDLPSNPDGYIGDCFVSHDQDDVPILNTRGQVSYVVFGVPIGNLQLSLFAGGNGCIKIRGIKNNTRVKYSGGIPTYIDGWIDYATLDVSSPEVFCQKETTFTVAEAPLTPYEQICEGWGEKIMGVELLFDGNLFIKNISLVKL